jgi:ferredoxin
MKHTFYFILTALFIVLMAWGIDHNKSLPTAPASLIAQGYGGPIEMSMGISDQGAVTSLKILKHNETTSYVSHFNDFLRQFIGRTAKDSFILGKDIDAISGATVSSAAITDVIRNTMHAEEFRGHVPNSLRELAVHVPEIPIKSPKAPFVISLALFLIAIIALITRNNALRWAALAGGFVYFGTIKHTMLSIVQIVQAGLGHPPSFTQDPLTWIILLFVLVSTLIVGRIYCGSLCPFAIIQEILYQLTPHKHPLKEHVSPHVDEKARLIKYILLFVVTGVCLILGNAFAANMEPFVTLFAGHGSKLAFSLLILMLIMAVFNFRFWCKYLCPVGALTSLGAAFSINKIRPTKKCTACGACTRACPTQAITPNEKGIPAVDAAECIGCAKCLRACPSNALTFGCACHEKE